MLPHRALVPVLLFSVWQFARSQDVVNQKLSHVRGKLLFISQQCKEDGANSELSRGSLRTRNAAQFSRELIFCSDFLSSQEEGGGGVQQQVARFTKQQKTRRQVLGQKVVPSLISCFPKRERECRQRGQRLGGRKSLMMS